MCSSDLPLLRLRPDGTPEMLVIGSLEAGAARYEATDEARQAWAAGQAIRARAARAQRARAWLAENGTKPAHKRAGYDYGEGEHPCTTS